MGEGHLTPAHTSHPPGSPGGGSAGSGVSALCSRLSINEANIELLWPFHGVPAHDRPVGFLEEKVRY